MTLVQDLKAGDTILLFGNRFDISAVRVGTQGVTLEGIEHTGQPESPPGSFTTVFGESFEVVGQHLTEEMKEKIRKDFRSWSGGFDANVAADELELYIEHQNYDSSVPWELVEAFLLEWRDEPEDRTPAAVKEGMKIVLNQVAPTHGPNGAFYALEVELPNGKIVTIASPVSDEDGATATPNKGKSDITVDDEVVYSELA